ncbi:MAG: 50S ribosome-binding GTPase [Lachnospiraceae bacterium]|nr:50S ribosome-binding GTPase [Lachnospiraceae bacterium]
MKKDSGIKIKFTPEALYFGAYIAVSDRKFFYDEWKKMTALVASHNYDDEIYQNTLAIVRDKDTKIKWEDLIERISRASVEIKETALCFGLEIAFYDEILDDVEIELFNQVRAKWSIDKKRFEEIKRLVLESIKNKPAQTKITNEIFDAKEYVQVRKEMERISAEDAKISMEVLEASVKQLNAYPTLIDKQIDKIVKSSYSLQESEQKKEMERYLEQLSQTISKVIGDASKDLSVLRKKQTKISEHFTISFMGRTKAGKSTIHSILLEDIDNDFIGKGMERTTRYNYIYDYNGIRIIDTPGIGAPNGQTDTEIAKEVADESDLICYVVTSDSIQETEFDFLQYLKEKNKPVIILLNKKENIIRSSKTKERFLENPLDWYTRDGEDAIQGHIDRITEYVSKRFHYQNYMIIPVQLLAAKISFTEDDLQVKSQLMIGSRIQIFIDKLFEVICESGILQKSQTIYNASIYYLQKNSNIFEEQSASFRKIKAEINNYSNECIHKIDIITKKSRNEIINSLNALIDDFIAQEIRRFARENYGKKKEEVNKAWKKLLDEVNIEQRLKMEYEEIWDSYMHNVEDIMAETEENMNFSVEFGNLSEIRLVRIFDTKFAINAVNGILTIVGLFLATANPMIGTVLTIVALSGAISNLFIKSKKKKIEEAKDKLYIELKENMENIREKVLKDLLQKYDMAAETINKNIKRNFSLIADSFEKVGENLALLQKEQRLFMDKLNLLFGARIANYIAGKPLYNVSDEKTITGLTVEREFGKQIKITDNKIYVSSRKVEPDRVSQILQEEIIVLGGE